MPYRENPIFAIFCKNRNWLSVIYKEKALIGVDSNYWMEILSKDRYFCKEIKLAGEKFSKKTMWVIIIKCEFDIRNEQNSLSYR